MYRCNHNDCFSCPYDDCISDTSPKGSVSKRKKLSKDEAKLRRKENNKRYYYKNREKISELHRKYYQEQKNQSGK